MYYSSLPQSDTFILYLTLKPFKLVEEHYNITGHAIFIKYQPFEVKTFIFFEDHFDLRHITYSKFFMTFPIAKNFLERQMVVLNRSKNETKGNFRKLVGFFLITLSFVLATCFYNDY